MLRFENELIGQFALEDTIVKNRRMKTIIEICLDSPEFAQEAERLGASRVELCANLLEGGTTPSAGCIARTRAAINIDLFVIIRPRGGNFYYTNSEIEEMKHNIQLCKELGVDGVVIGLLNTDGSIDLATTKMLVDLARPMKVTFHRAFDRCKNPLLALEQLIELGVERILTSGQMPKALDGIDLIAALIQQAGDRIIIMPGSGVNPTNAAEFLKVGATEIHFTAHRYEPAEGCFLHPNFPKEAYQIKVVDKAKIKDCLEAIADFKTRN